jgi:phosphonate transport system permease protein
VSRRGRLLTGLLLAAGLAWASLGLAPGDALPGETGRGILRLFCEGALSPALTYEDGSAPADAPLLLVRVGGALWKTLIFAAAGMSLALVIGLLFGFLGARSWWTDDERECEVRARARAPVRRVMTLVHVSVRVLIALMRSVHELLWAVLLLAALGLTSFSAVIAIAIPYGGTLAKVFSEMLDECPRDSVRSLRAIGAGGVGVFAWGLLPRAAGDMSAYAFYRFECAVRSSAILGFFGYPTIGYYLRLSAENVHYREVWTYLYALLALVGLLELWSSKLRRRVVMR